MGYRYFETAAKEKVMFPFGFGLSYTSFDIKLLEFSISEDNNPIASFRISVTNTGKYTGKEVVQIYVNQPQGKLGKPEKVLVGFAKTKELIMYESETITINVRLMDMASFDDTGVTGYKNCNVLENGKYAFYIGNNVRDASCPAWPSACVPSSRSPPARAGPSISSS